jgi:sterol desaturase/sphingolipid hydroxylase (fatty acid hydroxylase superfamily)
MDLDFPNIIAIAGPIMVALVALEWYFNKKHHKDDYDTKDTIAATLVGIGNVALGAALKVFTFGIAIWCFNVSPFRIDWPWYYSFPVCLVGIDFMRYWAHRVGHESRIWWATHVTHHSSQKYNLSVSFRLGWTQYVKIVFFMPVMLMGFDPVVFFIAHQVEVLYQFWIHSAYIDKLPRWIEYIFTTPSHHRVHHSTNPQYMDKNYGSTLIIWDRMFGTFEPEVEQPVYGITKKLEKPYNPVYLVFHKWADIVRDVRGAKSFKQAMRFIFANPKNL